MQCVNSYRNKDFQCKPISDSKFNLSTFFSTLQTATSTRDDKRSILSHADAAELRREPGPISFISRKDRREHRERVAKPALAIRRVHSAKTTSCEPSAMQPILRILRSLRETRNSRRRKVCIKAVFRKTNHPFYSIN